MTVLASSDRVILELVVIPPTALSTDYGPDDALKDAETALVGAGFTIGNENQLARGVGAGK